MEQNTVSQYDDDLTVGIEETEEFLDTGFVDLFEYSSNNGSPISRLKTIVLSLDWEINDEVLTQFNDELNVLKDVWADDQVKLVYIQALEKISKYIYQKKADAHPTAIKLLLTFYYNLEKIVLDAELSDAEIKNILTEDVQRFEQLKQQIGSVSKTDETKEQEEPETGPLPAKTGQTESRPILFNLKACILGMDWEITERELNDLSQEIAHLEGEFAGRKSYMIFLQGISALGGYIKLKKSDAHADAFKLLYSFYESLEKIVVNPELTKDEVKSILLPEVEKFEDFKQIIASTITPEALAEKVEEEQPAQYAQDESNSVSPAFADVPGEVHGFQAEEEVTSLGDPTAEVDDTVDNFLAGEESEPESIDEAVILPPEALEKIDSFFGDDIVDDALAASAISAEEALKGVDVETEADDDSEEEALPTQDDGMLAPALADSGEGDPHGFNPEPASQSLVGEMFVEEDATTAVSHAAALQGVNVETDADDVSGEPPLPLENEDIAPALASEESVFDTIESDQNEVTSEIDDQIKGFFGEDQEENIFADDDLSPDVAESSASEAATGDNGSEELSDGFEARLDSFFPEMDEENAAVSDSGELVEDSEDDVLFEVVDDDEAVAAEGEDLPYGIADDEVEADLVSQDFDSMGDGEEVQSDFDAEVDELEAVLESEAEKELGIVEEQIVSEPEGKAEVIEPEPETELEAERVDEERGPEFADETEEPVTELEFEEERVDDDVDSEFGGEAEAIEPESETELEAERVDEDRAPEFADESEEPKAEVEAFVSEFAGDPDEPITEMDSEVETFDDEEQKSASAFSAGAVGVAAASAAVSSFGSHSDEDDFFAAIDERVEEPGEIQMELLSETDELDHGMVPDHDESEEREFPPDTEDVSELEEIYSESEEVAEEENDQPVLFAVGDELSELRAGVASLGVEINDSIIEGLLSEINHLRHRMMTKPVEKTFLQLLSTIVQHIGQYRYESSSDAHTLVLSVFDKLELTQNSETKPEQAQEILLAETCKVLLWQQKMLDRQAVLTSDDYTSDPLRSSAHAVENNDFQLAVDQGDEHDALVEEPVEQKNFNAVFEPVDEDDFVTSEEIQAAQEEQELEMGDTFVDDSGELLPDVVDDEKLDVKGFSALLSDIVKREMKAFKELLQTELRALKDKLKDKDKEK